MQNFGLFIADRVRLKGNWRFHRSQGDELENMVWHHVTQRTRLIVVTAALLYSHRLNHRDLHVINVAAVPDWLENAICETKSQNILNGFFAQIVVNAIDLLFTNHLQELAV